MNKTRSALIIANYEHDDPEFQRLVSPGLDAEALGLILADPNIGDFQVTTLLNKSSYEISQTIEEFFDNRQKDDLVLLYFSGHGMKNEDGKLFLVSSDTRRKKLRSTAISANFINEIMLNSRSRKQILILDCCYSGAFAKGMLAKSSREMFINDQFEGQGRIVLTASNSIQYSFEGDSVHGNASYSVFTRALVDGLKTGEADLNQDGYISVEELYEYISKKDMLFQRPMKWSFDVYGDLIIAINPNRDPRKTEQPIHLKYVVEMVDHAKKEYPNMACGLLGGTDSGEITAYYPVRNIAKNPSNRFLVDADDQMKIFDELQSKGQTLLGLFYSDPHWKAYPSTISIKENAYSVLYFILSFNDPMFPVLRAFWLDVLNEKVKECELHIISKD